jgi:hypothetical protein
VRYCRRALCLCTLPAILALSAGSCARAVTPCAYRQPPMCTASGCQCSQLPISAGNDFACAVVSNGTVGCWGGTRLRLL